MSTSHQDQTPLEGLTESTPEPGYISSDHGVVLAHAERWFEDGLHVIRSVEFDLLAEDEDEDRVVDVFVDNFWDMGAALADLVRRGEATSHEQDLWLLFSQRMFEEAESSRRQASRRRIQIRLRQRDHHEGLWRRQTQATPSTPHSYA